ncbi:MAG TPA: peptide ABC transporter substrate-binding protein [Hyphomicrobiales bacterium]|nr:peptide ABC transporter substrate-binding protein [Hyphomicrobiales bacterium]
MRTARLPWLSAFRASLLPLLLACIPLAGQAQDVAVDFARQAVQIAMSGEPRSLNSTRTTDALSIFVIEHVMEGLIRKDEHNQLAPGVAERWEMDGTTARFWLRRDARWSDGKPVTAHDFVFAWRTVVDPATASEYAAIMFPVKNAEAINNGQLPVEALGVTALDDYTLEVELESPTGYFLSLTSFMIYYPVREDFYVAQRGRYFADVQNMLFNGPFKVTSWVHGASLRMEKNERYWNSGIVQLNVVDIPYITNDSQARFNLFKDGKLAVENGLSGLEAEQLRDALARRMRIYNHSDGSVFWIEFNHVAERPTRSKNLRKAIQAVYDSQELVYKVIGIAGYIPGETMIPAYMSGVQDKFRSEYPVTPAPIDLALARDYLEKARQELGVERIPPLSILADDREISMLQAQYFQALFKRTLDLDIKVDIQTFKQRLERMNSGNFDMVISGWGPDYEDPMTFADLFASWNINNHGHYESTAYDSYIRAAQGSADPKTRMDAMGKAQQLIIDDAVILPTYERVVNIVRHPRLEGLQFKQTGASMVFTYARVVE